MRIRKIATSVGVLGKILNSLNSSKQDTYSCDYINKLNTYSDEEQIIGMTEDGKNLYKKRLFLTTPLTTSSTKIASFDKTFIVKDYDGKVFISASNQLLPINFYFTDKYNIATYVVNNSGEIYMKIGSEAYENQQVILTIKYTKTTD